MTDAIEKATHDELMHMIAAATNKAGSEHGFHSERDHAAGTTACLYFLQLLREHKAKQAEDVIQELAFLIDAVLKGYGITDHRFVKKHADIINGAYKPRQALTQGDGE